MWSSLQNISPMLQMALLVLAVLLAASVAVIALRRVQPKKDFSELSARVRAWWIMAAVFFAAIVVSNRVSLVFFALMSFWALKEYVTLLRTRPADHHALVLITPGLLTRVTGQISERGLLALLLGPLKGIPYKIYAVEWGARRGTFIGFLLISVPARYVRFFLAALAARVIARLIQPLTHHHAVIEIPILAAIWITFYTFYFARFGW